jgi:two-component system OmpR family sensor kinase
MSLRARLLLLLLSATLVTTLTATAATYYWARRELDQLFDYQLRQQALALRDNARTSIIGSQIEPEPDQHIAIQIWDRRGTRLYLSHRGMSLPRMTELGYGSAIVDGQPWRTYTIAVGARVVQVAQPIGLRRQLAAGAAVRTLYPLLAVMLVLAAAIWWLVGHVLSPLTRLADSIAARQPTALKPVPHDKLPTEARAMVDAINGLIERLSEVLARQRRFMADAAHELRTPLTAVQLQAQVLERADTRAARSQAIAALKAGIARAAQLIERLLALARLDTGSTSVSFTKIKLRELAAKALREIAPLADARSVTLELDADEDVTMEAHAAGLYSLLVALVDNASRHGPAGGRVRVAITGDATEVEIRVEDDGPGIDPQEREHLFDRFYRIPGTAAEGSGLGLAVVKQVVELHRGRVGVNDRAGSPGTIFTVSLPRSAVASAASR